MSNFLQRWSGRTLVALTFLFLGGAAARAEDTLSWNTNRNIVSADIQSTELLRVLEGVAKLTGWQVYLEEGTTLNVSAKFKDLPSGDALRVLLKGDLNFALVPQSDARSRLYVFRTTQGNATQLVQPRDINPKTAAGAKKVPNELIVTLKPGVNIEEIARVLGAKITGRIDELNVYRLEFDDEAAAEAARASLEKNSDVAAVDANYYMDRPTSAQLYAGQAPEFDLQQRPNDGSCQVIVGLIDTPIQSLGKNLDSFFLPTISVAGPSANSGSLTHGEAMATAILQGIGANTGGRANSTGGKSSVKILPVDVYGKNANTSTFDVASGIQKAVNASANIVNLSLGSDGDSQFLHNLITKASGMGVVFFAAAGNQPVTTPVYPAAYPEVIAVTAANRQGQIADYANRGAFVDLMTPGTSIVPFGGKSYVVNGTSTATAYATGMAAGLADSAHNCPPQVIPLIQNKFGVKPR